MTPADHKHASGTGRHTRPTATSMRRRAPPGTAPGTLVPDPAAGPTSVRLIAYDADRLTEQPLDDIAALESVLEGHAVVWIDVVGLGDLNLIQALGDRFDLHRLSLEDVVNVHQRPKFEDYEDQAYIVTRMVTGHPKLDTEQVSLFLGEGYVLTFQERIGDCFEPVRDRLRQARGRIRERGPAYLAYALIDAVTDGYFPVLEKFGETVEGLEQEVLYNPQPHVMAQIHAVKRDLLTLRRSIWSQREMLNALLRDETHFVRDQTTVYLRDCYDHSVQLLDMVETYREITSGLVDVYLSSVSNRMNEIMKVLTIIATIFIPLTFIAGIYGMNFSQEASPWNMPELRWYWGYPAVLIVMAAIAAGLLWYFRRRGWLGSDRHHRRRGQRR